MSDRVSMDKKVEGDSKNIPRKGNIVTVDYIGYIASDNSKFDSTFDRKKPFKFRVESGEVIKGLDQGLVQMSKGECSRITIPPSLAYGDKGFPGLIPPRTTIIFEVTLRDVS